MLSVLRRVKVEGLSEDNRRRGLKLVYDIMNKEITEAEFEVEVAFLSMECGLEELVPQQYPSKPIALREYDSMSKKEKSKIPEEFWREPEIAEFTSVRAKCHSHNMASKWWLSELHKRFIAFNDTERAEKIKTLLDRFENFYL